MKDFGESRVMLGMDIVCNLNAGTLTLTQSRYASKVIERFGMSLARGCDTPMEAVLNLTAMKANRAKSSTVR